jgi:hypothetical protein
MSDIFTLPNLFTVLPPKGSVVYEYEPFFAGIEDPEKYASLLMYFSKNYCYKSKLNSFVWGSVIPNIKGEFEPKLQRIIDLYNKAPLKLNDNISGYFVFQFCNTSGWNCYYTPTPNEEGLKACKTKKVLEFEIDGVYKRISYTPFPKDMESVIVENVSEKDIFHLALQAHEHEVCDVNYMT